MTDQYTVGTSFMAQPFKTCWNGVFELSLFIS